MDLFRFYSVLILISINFIATLPIRADVVDEIREKTITWNTLNNNYDEAKLGELIMPKIVAYSEHQTRAEYLAMKRNFLKRQKSFSQSIVSPLSLSFYKANFVKCSFTKQATFNGKTKNYPAYLIFQEHDGHYLISGESDEVTDVNLGYNAHLPEPEEVRLVALNEEEHGVNWLYIILGFIAVVGFGVFVFLFFKKKPKAPPVVVESNVPEMENSKATQTELSNKEKGDAFEKYIARSFDKDSFTIVEWTSDKGIDGRYAESNMNPDLVFELNVPTQRAKFAVECKYKSSVDSSGFIELCSSAQLSRYKEYSIRQRIDVFIALGIGGTPDFPAEVYAIPIHILTHHKTELKKIKSYYKKPGGRFFYEKARRRLS